jgi:hypothetical protein
MSLECCHRPLFSSKGYRVESKPQHTLIATVSQHQGQLVCSGVGEIENERLEIQQTPSRALKECDSQGQQYFQDLVSMGKL